MIYCRKSNEGENMAFEEDDAIEIAATSIEAKKFEQKHPDCVWNVEKMSAKATREWIKKHPDAQFSQKGKAPPKHLWIVELEAIEEEKLVLIISPLTKKVIDATIEKLMPELEEEDELLDEEEEEFYEEEIIEEKTEEDIAIDIASKSDAVINFEKKHENCVWNVEPFKNLWKVELEALEEEKLILLINPSTNKIVEIKTEQIEPEPEDEEEFYDEEEEEEDVIEEEIFDEDKAIEIASVSNIAKNFEQKYPDCVWNIECMNAKDTEIWIKKHPETQIPLKGKNAPDHLWIVELEALEKEKLRLIINPVTSEIVLSETELIEAPFEEEEEEEELEEDLDEELEEKISEIATFNEDDAVRIASLSNEAKNFRKKYPNCVWNVEKMSPKMTEQWINSHPNVQIAPTGTPPQNLWRVELEALEKEKLILIINPSIKTIIDSRFEKIKPEK